MNPDDAVSRDAPERRVHETDRNFVTVVTVGHERASRCCVLAGWLGRRSSSRLTASIRSPSVLRRAGVRDVKLRGRAWNRAPVVAILVAHSRASHAPAVPFSYVPQLSLRRVRTCATLAGHGRVARPCANRAEGVEGTTAATVTTGRNEAAASAPASS